MVIFTVVLILFLSLDNTHTNSPSLSLALSIYLCLSLSFTYTYVHTLILSSSLISIDPSHTSSSITLIHTFSLLSYSFSPTPLTLSPLGLQRMGSKQAAQRKYQPNDSKPEVLRVLKYLGEINT